MRYNLRAAGTAVLAVLLVLATGSYSHAKRPDWAGKGVLPRNAVGLKNFPFDTVSGPPEIPPGLAKAPKKPGAPDYLIVKFTDSRNKTARGRLSHLGVRFYGYMPVNGFVAKVPPGRRAAVESDPSVEYVTDYLPAYRLDEAPLGRATRGEKGESRLIVQVFDDEPLGPVVSSIEGMGGVVDIISDRPGLNGKFIKVRIDASRTAELAATDGVMWVEDELVPEFFNDVAATITRVSDAWSLPASLTGTGQVVAVCDSGLDTGDTATLHADFSGTTSDGMPKLISTYDYGRTGDWSDPLGHGTHTAGSALGKGVKSDELMPGTFIRGMAYDAQLVFQSILAPGGGLAVPSLDLTVFPDAYSDGARVHTNSWGFLSSSGSYMIYSMLADTYTWEHKDFTVLFAAGNNGVDVDSDGVVDTGSVISPSTAKNVISVGASENLRNNITTLYGTSIPNTYSPPISNDRLADDPEGMAAFSSRGPCLDGRLKPDIVAPGTYVLSARSSLAPIEHYWRPASTTGAYDESLDPYYASEGGTSMATPQVAGAAALVRQALVRDGEAAPSSALIKALLITGAHDMTPGQYNAPKNDVTARPDVNQGWGRLDVKGSLFPDAPVYVAHVDEKQGVATGNSRNYTYTISDATVPLRVGLVWSDYPGASYANPALVNDLDLSVTAPGGDVYHGNRYSGSVSIPNDSEFDRLNNVEGVTVPAASLSTGALVVSVSGYNVPQGPQPFAIVVYGGLSDPPVVATITPDNGDMLQTTPVTITGSGFVDGCEVLIGETPCSIQSFATDSIDATVPAGIYPGTHAVVVRNPDLMSGALPGGFTVTGDTVPPAAPQGLVASPGDGSVNLAWQPGEPDITGYHIYFNTYSTTVGSVSTHKLTGLTNGVSYDIYIRAEDTYWNISDASQTVNATPFAKESEMPHYDWDGSPAWQCGSCHVTPSGGLLPQGFDYRYDASLCISCHNPASVGHRSPITTGGPHTSMPNVTSGVSSMPVFGTVTSGENSDTMYTHLKGGDTVVCTTCHNAMQKPHDSGRAWEVLYASGQDTYASSRGGWWDQGHTKLRSYRDSSLWTPQYSRDRDELRVTDGTYTYDEIAGTVTFTGQTSGYAYLTLSDPYLRAPGSDNTACTDCHVGFETHRGYNCLACHRVHGAKGIKSTRGTVRRPDGTDAPVVFGWYTGANSFADGDGTYDGICEVCHTKTAYYRSDGSVLNNHTSTGLDYSGADCTACHPHAAGFSPQ